MHLNFDPTAAQTDLICWYYICIYISKISNVDVMENTSSLNMNTNIFMLCSFRYSQLVYTSLRPLNMQRALSRVVFIACGYSILPKLSNLLPSPITTTKASLTSHRTCTYVLVTEKNRLICKGPSRNTCNFITESQGRTDPAMEIDMHISSACTQCVH